MLGYGFYSPTIVTMAALLAISEIFSVKGWPDPEIWVYLFIMIWYTKFGIVQGH